VFLRKLLWDLSVVLQRVFLWRPGQRERFTGLGVMVADVPPERYQSEDKRGEAYYKNRKQYAHGNQA
jgi:hypothetical protein